MALIIFLRVVLSVTANALQKRLLLARAGVGHTWVLTYSIMLLPALLWALPLPQTPGFWRDVAIGGALDAFGNLAMVAALRTTDISVFGPLNAIRPILALIFGWLFLAEKPTPVGLAGIAITVIGGGILLTGNSGRHQPSQSTRSTDPAEKPRAFIAEAWTAILLRTLGLALGVAGAVFLKRAALVSSAESTVAAWIACGLVCLISFGAITPAISGEAHSSHLDALRVHWKWLLLHSAVFLSMQWLTIRIFQATLLAYSFVFFQLGMVLQVFVGRVFFRERAFVRRLIAALVMAGGSILILLE